MTSIGLFKKCEKRMYKVVFDANIFVSALITPRGKTASLFLHSDKFRPVTSLDHLQEIAETFTHPHIAEKYAVTPAMVRDMFIRLKKHAVVESPKEKVHLVSCAMDNHLLALAKESKADFLATGDRELLDVKHINGTAIVTPAEFLTQLEEQESSHTRDRE